VRLVLMAVAIGLMPRIALAQTTELRLPAGERVMLAGTNVGMTLTEVQDQRCPLEADCYWEGMIRAVLSVRAGDADLPAVVLCNLCDDGTREAVIAGLRVTLVRVEPDREGQAKMGRAPELRDYVAVVTVGP
jgi:hypothetical protein